MTDGSSINYTALAIPQVTGKKLDELEKEWHDVIEQADASQIKYFAPRIGKQ